MTAVLLVSGVMDLRAMAVVTMAITVERLASNAQRVARVIGFFVVAAGLFLIWMKFMNSERKIRELL